MVRNNKGAVLLVTLWILSILSLLAVGIGFRASLELRLLAYQMNNLKVYEIAKAGVIKAIAELEKDETTDTDTIWECGIALKPDETQEDKFKDIKIGDGYFEVSYVNEEGDKIYGIEDVRAKININTAPDHVLQGLSPEITEDIAANIRAWRGNEEGIETTNRDYSDKPYSCKNAPFDVVDELLLVKDFGSEIFYGAPGGEHDAAIKNLVTAHDPSGEFKININTAGQKVLESLGLGESAQNVVNYRAGDDGYIMTSDDNKVFSDIGGVKEFLKDAEGGAFDDTALENLHLEDVLVFNSDYFKIKSIGTLEGRKSKIKKTITCVVRRQAGGEGEESGSETDIISWFEE